MKSHNVNDFGASDHPAGLMKEPWVTPSLEIIPLERAEGGSTVLAADNGGAHHNRPKS